jgi:endonuclease YncB( thermonuclease family)
MKEKKDLKKKSEALKSENLSVLVLLIIFFIITISIYYLSGIYKIEKNKSNSYNNLVIKVIDGYTFELENEERVRLLCVEAPEEGKPGYSESKSFLESLILNKSVKMEKDISDKDKYNQLLRYVGVNDSSGNEIFVNKEIFKKNFAKILKVEPDTKRCNEIENK